MRDGFSLIFLAGLLSLSAQADIVLVRAQGNLSVVYRELDTVHIKNCSSGLPTKTTRLCEEVTAPRAFMPFSRYQGRLAARLKKIETDGLVLDLMLQLSPAKSLVLRENEVNAGRYEAVVGAWYDQITVNGHLWTKSPAVFPMEEVASACGSLGRLLSWWDVGDLFTVDQHSGGGGGRIFYSWRKTGKAPEFLTALLEPGQSTWLPDGPSEDGFGPVCRSFSRDGDLGSSRGSFPVLCVKEGSPSETPDVPEMLDPGFDLPERLVNPGKTSYRITVPGGPEETMLPSGGSCDSCEHLRYSIYQYTRRYNGKYHSLSMRYYSEGKCEEGRSKDPRCGG